MQLDGNNAFLSASAAAIARLRPKASALLIHSTLKRDPKVTLMRPLQGSHTNHLPIYCFSTNWHAKLPHSADFRTAAAIMRLVGGKTSSVFVAIGGIMSEVKFDPYRVASVLNWVMSICPKG